GIGKAIALRFAQEGARVALNDINDESLKEAAREIQKIGREKTICKKADVSKSEEVEELTQYMVEKLGVIDILVNNAAISRIIPFLDTSEKLWDRIMEVNLKGAFLCCKAVIPGMIKKGGGKIINMSSQSGKRGSAWHAAYCVSKFGIIGLTQSLALELAPYKINVNAVCPGVVFTPLWEEQASKEKELHSLRNLAYSKTEELERSSKIALEKAAAQGAGIIEDNDKIMTCSYSSTIKEVFRIAHRCEKDVRVWISESKHKDKSYGKL
ncbi:unnamed protein product, partial [marine sediment metagenome]